MRHDEVEILLIEDNPNDLELTLRALKRTQLVKRIEVARDGAEALDFIFGSDPQDPRPPGRLPKLILLDLKLPKVDGLEVLQRLKSDTRTRQLPVIMLSTSREARDIAQSYELGANSYIVKPVDFESFTETVRQVGQYWLSLNHPPQGS
ncbi:MAG: response regulator [Chloroflexi bacterium]|nr:response regulator [Chloroflexota bacterium]